MDGIRTEMYRNMASEGERSFNNGEKDLDMLFKERELGFEIFRSPSAPPTIEGNSIGVSFSDNNGGVGGVSREVSENEYMSDPAYINYYYSNVNLNPRLPPPLLSKEDWRFTQRWSGEHEPGLGGIGDRRKVSGGSNNRDEFNGSNVRGNIPESNSNNGGIGSSLFSIGLNGVQEEENNGQNQWNGVGLPGLGMGRRQKSFAEIIQVTYLIFFDVLMIVILMF